MRKEFPSQTENRKQWIIDTVRANQVIVSGILFYAAVEDWVAAKEDLSRLHKHNQAKKECPYNGPEIVAQTHPIYTVLNAPGEITNHLVMPTAFANFHLISPVTDSVLPSQSCNERI